MTLLNFESIQVLAGCDGVAPTAGGYILSGKHVSLQISVPIRSFYCHGWQSWSLAAWIDNKPLPIPAPSILHPLQVDPVYVQHRVPNGSWVGAVEFVDGSILLLGALGLDSHVQLRQDELQGWFETDEHAEGPQTWFVGVGDEASIFSLYAELLRQQLGQAHSFRPQRVWCSWYSFYRAIDENSMAKELEALGDLAFDVFQVDDGWQMAIGDWQANSRFPTGMESLATRIKSTGRKAGLWLAPLLVVPSSKLFKEHHDWLLRDEENKLVSAGFNWGEPLYALDTSHPEVLLWLKNLMEQIHGWGFEYIKIDFLYAGALPGKRHINMPREAAYRQGLGAMRDGLGQDVFLLTCGAPIIPSLGLCDGLRVGPDVAAVWERYLDAELLYNPATPGARNAIRTSINRLWLAPLVQIDPDVAYFRTANSGLTIAQNRMLQDLAMVCNFKATSDLPQWLTNEEQKQLRLFLQHQPEIKRTGRFTFQIGKERVDFGAAADLPPHPRWFMLLLRAIVSWLGNQPAILWMIYQVEQKKYEVLKSKG